jgi:hypothetical protein
VCVCVCVWQCSLLILPVASVYSSRSIAVVYTHLVVREEPPLCVWQCSLQVHTAVACTRLAVLNVTAPSHSVSTCAQLLCARAGEKSGHVWQSSLLVYGSTYSSSIAVAYAHLVVLDVDDE